MLAFRKKHCGHGCDEQSVKGFVDPENIFKPAEIGL